MSLTSRNNPKQRVSTVVSATIFNNITHLKNRISEMRKKSELVNGEHNDPRLHYEQFQSWSQPMQTILQDIPLVIRRKTEKSIIGVTIYPLDGDFDDKDLEAFGKISTRVLPTLEGMYLEDAEELTKALNDRARGKTRQEAGENCLKVEGAVMAWGYTIGNIFISELVVCIVLRRKKVEHKHYQRPSSSIYYSCLSHRSDSASANTPTPENQSAATHQPNNHFEPTDYLKHGPKGRITELQAIDTGGRSLQTIEVAKEASQGTKAKLDVGVSVRMSVENPIKISLSISLQSVHDGPKNDDATTTCLTKPPQTQNLIDTARGSSNMLGMANQIVVRGNRGLVDRFGFGGPHRAASHRSINSPSRIPRLGILSISKGKKAATANGGKICEPATRKPQAPKEASRGASPRLYGSRNIPIPSKISRSRTQHQHLPLVGEGQVASELASSQNSGNTRARSQQGNFGMRNSVSLNKKEVSSKAHKDRRVKKEHEVKDTPRKQVSPPKINSRDDGHGVPLKKGIEGGSHEKGLGPKNEKRSFQRSIIWK